MLVLAKKPDEAFKAPLNTKKQAPVTVGNKKSKQKENKRSGGRISPDNKRDMETGQSEG